MKLVAYYAIIALACLADLTPATYQGLMTFTSSDDFPEYINEAGGQRGTLVRPSDEKDVFSVVNKPKERLSRRLLVLFCTDLDPKCFQIKQVFSQLHVYMPQAIEDETL